MFGHIKKESAFRRLASYSWHLSAVNPHDCLSAMPQPDHIPPSYSKRRSTGIDRSELIGSDSGGVIALAFLCSESFKQTFPPGQSRQIGQRNFLLARVKVTWKGPAGSGGDQNLSASVEPSSPTSWLTCNRLPSSAHHPDYKSLPQREERAVILQPALQEGPARLSSLYLSNGSVNGSSFSSSPCPECQFSRRTDCSW
jgi:hypothetical protein